MHLHLVHHRVDVNPIAEFFERQMPVERLNLKKKNIDSCYSHLFKETQ